MAWMPAATLIGPMAATIGLSYLLNQAALFVAPRIGLVDKPDGGRKSHKKPTPVMGGVAFVFAILVVCTASLVFHAEWLADDSVRQLALSLGASALCFCFLGVCDDRWPLTPRVKLIGQILSSLPFVSLNSAVETIGFLGWELPLGPIGGPVTILWLVACANVVNLIDGLDGLAGSIGLVVITTIAALFALQNHPQEAILTTVIAGGIIGFLCHNWPPAKIFMGDAGSMTIGFLAGALSIHAFSKTATTFTLAVPVVLMSIPIFDTVMAILRRKLTGRSIGEGDRCHIHHRLQDHGLSRQQALLAIAGLSLVMSGAVLVSVIQQSEAYALAICGIVLVLLILGRVFGYHETSLIFNHLKALGDLLVDTTGVLRTRLFLVRLANIDDQQRSQLWDQVVMRVAQMKASRLDYRCESTLDDRVSMRLSWENSDVDLVADGAVWQVAYQVPRENGLVAKLDARGRVSATEEPPRADDLFRLFATVSLELPTGERLAPTPRPALLDDEPHSLPFPTPVAVQPVRSAA